MEDELDALRAIVHESLMAVSPLERYRPGEKRHARHEGMSLMTTGAPGPDFNNVLVIDAVPADQVFARASAFFGEGALYSMIVEVGTANEVESELLAQGWQLDEEEPALVLPRLPTSFPAEPASLSIRQVDDAAGFTAFMTISQTPEYFVPSLEAVLDPAAAVFAGYVGDRPVAFSRLVCLGPIAELTGIVTVADYQRRGYGTALTWAALAGGAERGCTAATLTATPMGYPVYIRMGFQPAGVYRTYMPPG